VLRNNVGTPESSELRFTVYADSIENRFVATDPDLMTAIADITGGQTLAPDELDELPDLLEAFQRSTREESEPEDVWDRFPVFLAIVCLLAVEWFLRRRSGLV